MITTRCKKCNSPAEYSDGLCGMCFDRKVEIQSIGIVVVVIALMLLALGAIAYIKSIR